MKRLIIICGPTATGKTSLALHLKKLIRGEIISADSRQVYKYMDIGTGKEKPKGSQIYGYDLVAPDEDFSVKNYADFAFSKIAEIYEKKKLPILVGGTGLYIKAVSGNLQRIYIPRDLVLRKKLKNKTADELFEILMKKNPEEALKLNNSDKKNARRLMRLLEIVFSQKKNISSPFKFDDIFWIGLFCPQKTLEEKIEKRVEERLKMGFEKEIEFLKRKGFWTKVPQATLGYREWGEFLEGKLTKLEAIKKWKQEERKYAKRQMTWFGKEKNIRWFDVSQKDWLKEVEKVAKTWYLKTNATQG